MKTRKWAVLALVALLVVFLSSPAVSLPPVVFGETNPAKIGLYFAFSSGLTERQKVILKNWVTTQVPLTGLGYYLSLREYTGPVETGENPFVLVDFDFSESTLGVFISFKHSGGERNFSHVSLRTLPNAHT